ncbi:hypothetical protein ACE1ET_15315 [Saccharicrinis sp. FJH62]|uniref:hypothetical protein n=1 Tax=Saccharicrinis sp. FJH62 TaxID=3344657 RepID=UPI0035D4E345
MKKILLIYLFLIPMILSFGQISPGDLSSFHQDLEGISNCTKCHELGKKVSNAKCLDCHKEVAVRIDTGEGFHSSTEVKGKSCFECHNEHHGREYDLTDLNTETFDHNLTGYKLEGAHADQDCEACHKKEFIQDKEIKKKTMTYLGLVQECLACHKDFHRETLSDNCLECHNYEKFRPAPGFNHNETDFVLKGKHQQVDCIECHKDEIIDGEEFQHFANVDHSNCTSCHEDVHNNRFGQNCRQCHTEESFTIIKGMNTFDHSKTGYPLEGMHVNVDCKECHTTGKYTDPLQHKYCNNCHEDYHKGEFTAEKKYTDCSDCHTVKGFKRSNFTIEMHNESAFKLEGAHLATPCFACHKKQEDWHFRKIGTNCADCHENIHQDYMEAKYTDNNGCMNCHTVNTWAKVTFDHDQTGFELSGVHAQTDCSSCHFPKNENQVKEQKFASLKGACLECHTDEHRGQFEKYGDKGCEQCHGFDNWEAGKFNHDNTRFKLEGAHASVDCYQCHSEVRTLKGRYVKYLYDNEKIECATCHK